MPQKRWFCLFILSFLFLAHPSQADSLKVGFVTDWEYGTHNSGNKKCTKAPEYLNRVVKELNTKSPHLVIGGGDYIESTKVSSKDARSQIKEINKVFKKLKTDKLYYLPGNHDLRSLTTTQYKSALGINYLHKKIDTRGFRLLLLDTNFKSNSSHRSDESFVEGYVSTKELNWLKEQIDSSPYPVIIFSHHSPARPNGRRDIKNSDAVRNVIEQGSKVIAVVSGHNPTQTMKTLNGVNYIVVNNLVDHKAKRTYAFIKVEKNGSKVSFSLKQYGSKRATHKFEKTL